jgi:hypothetical protein
MKEKLHKAVECIIEEIISACEAAPTCEDLERMAHTISTLSSIVYYSDSVDACKALAQRYREQTTKTETKKEAN